jgi:hypothetical protein
VPEGPPALPDSTCVIEIFCSSLPAPSQASATLGKSCADTRRLARTHAAHFMVVNILYISLSFAQIWSGLFLLPFLRYPGQQVTDFAINLTVTTAVRARNQDSSEHSYGDQDARERGNKPQRPVRTPRAHSGLRCSRVSQSPGHGTLALCHPSLLRTSHTRAPGGGWVLAAGVSRRLAPMVRAVCPARRSRHGGSRCGHPDRCPSHTGERSCLSASVSTGSGLSARWPLPTAAVMVRGWCGPA